MQIAAARWTVKLLVVLSILNVSAEDSNKQPPRAYRSIIDPNPVGDDGSFWYRIQTGPSRSEFVLVDVKQKTRRRAFDHKKMAAALSLALESEFTPEDLPIQTLTVRPNGVAVVLHSQSDVWFLDSNTHELTKEQKTTIRRQDNWLQLAPIRSASSTEDVEFVLQNGLPDEVELLWIAPSGEERSYHKIAPGQSLRQHSLRGHVWQVQTKSSVRLGRFRCGAPEQTLVLNEEAVRKAMLSRPRSSRSRPDPASKSASTIEVRDDNLWLVNPAGISKQITKDAVSSNSFRRDASRARLADMKYSRKDFPANEADVSWSPEQSRFVAFQTSQVPERQVYYIESLPNDSTEPIVHSYPYAKPGDELPIRTPRLFLVDGTEIPIDNKLFPNPFRLSRLKWSKDGSRFYMRYDERGHQVVRILQVDATTGEVQTVVEETSDTFIQYSDANKSLQIGLDDDQMLWASERSGWNHLYLYDKRERRLVNAVTSGEWNVRRIHDVDQEERTIWFFAVGLIEGQDPYHEHLCRVNFDGTGFRILTEGDGTHTIVDTIGESYFIDKYSRVDMAPIHELRSLTDGSLIVALEEGDASEVVEAAGSLPIRFKAKGRDGKTDIWGIIHLPKNFTEGASYPIVENIYAGPHDHHVPKAFRVRYKHQREIADSGMIVVQIDGMGTAWRSKKFHDVCFQNLKDAGFPDRIAWIEAVAKQYPEADLNRVGIYGGSAGGQNAMAALLWHGDFYKAAVADCGCHDNRVDKIWWNEQWMGWPVGPEYAQNSNTEHAHLLTGDLMLVVGELDRNVDPASTTQVVSRLIEADKDFDFLLMTGRGHGACESDYGRRRRLKFLTEHLAVKP